MPLLSIEHLSVKFGQKTVLDNVSLDVNEGDVAVVIGPSGSGKTTFIRCLNGLQKPCDGTLTLHGTSYGGGSTHGWEDLRHHVGMVFQDYSLFPHLSVLENMTLAPVLKKRMSNGEAQKKALDLLARVRLQDKANARPRTLSGGQQQRVAIARALLMKPEFMLFDEPTSALDPELVGEVLNVIRDLAKDGVTLMIVTHHMGFAKAAANKVIFFDQGQLIEVGHPDTILEHPREPRVKDFLKKIM